MDNYVDHQIAKRKTKMRFATVGILCLAAVGTSACVMQSTYDSAVADRDATTAELGSVTSQLEELTAQVSELQQSRNDFERQVEAASSALQQAKQGVEAEQNAAQARLTTLTRAIGQLTAQQKNLQYALQRAAEAQGPLQSAVDEYRAKLGETDEARTPRFVEAAPPADKQTGTALVPPVSATAPIDSAPKPALTPPAASVGQAAVKPMPPPAEKQTAEPVEEGWLPKLKGWVLSLWQSIFS